MVAYGVPEAANTVTLVAAIIVGLLDWDKSICDTTTLLDPVVVVLGVLHSS